MATTSLENRPQLAANIREVLGLLRALIVAYIWVEGLAAAVAWLGIAFWISLGIDWYLEPAVAVRKAILVAVAAVLAGALYYWIGRRTFVPLRASSMATVLERRFADLDDSLLTAVVLTGRQTDPEKCNPDMLAHTCWEAAERIRGVQLRRVFNPWPLALSLAGAGFFAVSVAVFAALCPGWMAIWAHRNLALSDEVVWPRNARLVMDGFPDGKVKVARSADVTVVVRADTSFPVIPEVVEIRYRTEGGVRDRRPMNREGAAEYNHTFQGVLSSIDFDVVERPTGLLDWLSRRASVRGLRIEVVDNPTISEMVLHCKFPDYMPRSPQSLPVTGVMQLPLGTRIEVEAKANKPLQRVQIDVVGGDQSAPPQVISQSGLDRGGHGFRYTLDSLRGDSTLLFSLTDSDGIRSREAVRLVLVAMPDEPPQLSVRLDGIGTAITPEARLPLVGQITDDNGIDRVWAEMAIDQQPLPEQTLLSPPKHPANIELAEVAIEVRPMELSPGQKVLICVKASDLYNLGKGPNVGTSERWLLDVVTAEQLRAMLEARELVLRQRFERIIQEVTETRELVQRIRFAAEPAGPEAEGAKKAGTEPGEEPQEGPKDQAQQGKEDPAKREASMRTLRTQQALQNSRKNAQETLGVAESFDDIRKQLVNNRIDTEELKMRLEDRIAKPLHHIAGEMFPELERRLDRLQEAVADLDRGPQQRDRAAQQADDIVIAMQQVLQQMIELEDYNQLVDTLRTIIKLQDVINELTKLRHKQKIRDLKEP